MNLPDNMKATITIIWKEQDKAVKLWEELIEMGFKFKWKGKYLKDKLTFNVAYNSDIKEDYQREVKFDEIKPDKPKRKKRIKPAQKK